MGYRITYENGSIRKETVKIRKLKWKQCLIGMIAAVLAFAMMIPGGRLWLRDLILPGDEEITAAALENMVGELRSGEPVGEALEAFCREILAGGA